MVELADTRDLKSLDGDIVPVRPRLAAPVESLDAQVAFGALVLLRLFPRACGGFRFVSASRTEPGRSPRPRRSLFFCRIARAGGAQLFVGGSESSASTRKSRSGLSFCSGFFPALDGKPCAENSGCRASSQSGQTCSPGHILRKRQIRAGRCSCADDCNCSCGAA